MAEAEGEGWAGCRSGRLVIVVLGGERAAFGVIGGCFAVGVLGLGVWLRSGFLGSVSWAFFCAWRF